MRDTQLEADSLNKRFAGINRAAFAREYKVPGGAAMIYQHINGIKPISLDAAKAYATGFKCPLSEISQYLASETENAARHLSLSSNTNGDGIGAESQPGLITGFSAMDTSATVRHISRSNTYCIPQYEAGGSMGAGLVLPDQPGVIENWNVSREWLEKNAKGYTAFHNLCIVTGFGPSMQPMFNPGDPLLVDRGVTSVVADGIYFFRVGDEGFIKQLQKIPTADGLKYVAKSKNPDYDPFEITQDMDFEVLGKVMRVWCGTDF